jgi:hypothetical protein
LEISGHWALHVHAAMATPNLRRKVASRYQVGPTVCRERNSN